MTITQRRALLRRIDVFLCKLFGIEPAPGSAPHTLAAERELAESFAALDRERREVWEWLERR